MQEYLAAIALVQGHYRDRDRGKGLVVGALAGQTVEQDDPRIWPRKKETAVVESWREPLRLCLTACNDDEADAALLAILQPPPGETETERPRAVMAALCLADEPSVEDDTAAQVLETLVGVVDQRDGMGHANTTLDAAAMALANSRWSERLAETLLTAFMGTEPVDRANPGGLFAMIQGKSLPNGSEIAAQRLRALSQELCSCDDRRAAGIALTVMDLAKQ